MKNVLLSKIRIVLMISAVVLFIACVCSSYSMPANGVNTARQYRKYNAETGTWIGSYSLTVEHGEQPMLCDLVGTEDSRYIDWSKSGVVKICGFDEKGDGKDLGTGFVIGKNTIATAAHVVSKYGNGKYTPDRIKCIKLFNSDGTVADTLFSKNKSTNMTYHVPVKFYNDEWSYVDDYAVIKVSEDLSEYQCFDLGYVTDSLIKSNSANVFVTGFPAYVRGEKVNTYDTDNMYTGEGVILNQEQYGKEISNGLIYYTADTSGGNSGSPVYIEETVRGKTFYTVIGMLSTGDGIPLYRFNCGVRFDSDILKFYKGNPYI